eukprot:CAMPEP_0173207562 /NCGR_PEP_ID=MMETSP1141-20130122/21998_1 /TAXON_ID=483371 /ORGANISM="non described non described, Strain CCMP2298" /LENGTH=74 /DNA_ID=CAMNT_0014133853 /DNA_START=238 /DNA_END=459 /DNA_ORIENTATION=+
MGKHGQAFHLAGGGRVNLSCGISCTEMERIRSALGTSREPLLRLPVGEADFRPMPPMPPMPPVPTAETVLRLAD